MTPFVGRQAELAKIVQTMTRPTCRLLTLCGPGGIGKTRLAIEAAHALTDNFEALTRFVALQSLPSAAFMLQAIAEALEMRLSPGSDPKQLLLNALHDKSLLLVLDNFEHLLDGVDFLSEILASAPAVKILVTSRERLNLMEEWVLNIEGLTIPPDAAVDELDQYEAVQLFLQTAQRVAVDFTLPHDQKPALVRICQLVEGMPLAVELAATWVRTLSCQEIVTELENSLDILATPMRNIPSRHRNMRAALDHSWNLLTAEEQSIFKQLSVFQGGLTREAAQAVTGASVWVLTALVDKSLVRVRSNGRYTLQELLRQYAEGQLAAAGEADAAKTAHSLYYADFLQQRWPLLRSDRQHLVLIEIDQELDNIRAAWETMCQQRNVAAIEQSVRSVWFGFDLRCRFHEMIRLFNDGIEALSPIAGTPEVDRVLGLLVAFKGWSHVGISQPAVGKRIVQDGLRLLRTVGTDEDIWLGLFCLQLTTDFMPEPIATWRVCRQCVAIARKSNNTWMLARSLHQLANLTLWFATNPDLPNAKAETVINNGRQLGEQALLLAEQWGDLWLRASITGILLGNLNRRLENFPEAVRCYEQSLPLFEQIGQSWAIGAVHRMLGLTYFAAGDYPGAFYHYQVSLRVFAENGQLHEQLWDLNYMAELLIHMAEYQSAIVILLMVVEQSTGPHVGHSHAGNLLAELQAKLGPEKYEALVAQAEKLDLKQVMHKMLERPSSPPSVALPAPLVTPLTERELDVLKLMSLGLTNREIAERLFLSVGTVKWYTSQIMDKLNVRNRTQAVSEADKLNLLA